ncbi:MAG: sialate O-acetylesterase [Paludibacteraceae bacterium]|nr:sialate O-acetylesterase [Paludibacteraceae bacterium]
MNFKKIFLLIFSFFILHFSLNADVVLPKLIADGMVLQRDTKVNVWGWADPNEKVIVSIDGKLYSTKADASGNWLLKLKKHKAGGPYTMLIEGKNKIEIRNVVFGDVWLCSGQSNMELPMRRVKPLYEAEMAKASNPMIRCFDVPQKYNFKVPQENYHGNPSWKEVNAETVLSYSAVAYFFATEINRVKNVPVGIINASLGGSPVQAWMSEDALRAFPAHLEEGYRWRNDQLIMDTETFERQRTNEWYQLSTHNDIGQAGNFKNPDTDDSQWTDFKVPGYWSKAGKPENGVFWFRREIQISATEAGKPAFLNMGRIVDADSVFVNGHFVGNVTYQYPPRWYNVPAGVLVEGRNVLVVRVVNNSGSGGFVPDKPYVLALPNRNISLEGTWKMKKGCEMPPLPGETFVRWKPMGLFNGMIAPMLNFNIKGAIWYQGESNTANPAEYARMFPAMIRNWRSQFRQGDFPFLFVQLANFMEAKTQPVESNWAETREAQEAALALKNTAMAVTIDIGEWNDIHPLNKKDVGVRLALAARKVAYGESKIRSAGPVFKSLKVKGNKLIISFKNAEAGLKSGGEELQEFAVAGADAKFVWAKARIEGNKVIVSALQVQNPVYVRYAWADNPHRANLRNTEGLPAAPFRATIKKK